MPSTPPKMRSKKEFVSDTTPFSIFNRGRSSMVELDAAMATWDAVKLAGSPDAKCTALVVVMHECKSWLILKASRTTASAAARRIVVTSLAQQAFAAYSHWMFEQRKARGATRTLKPLAGDYAIERSAFKASGKKLAPSMSTIHQYRDKLGYMAEKKELYNPSPRVLALTALYTKHEHGWTPPAVVWTEQDVIDVLNAIPAEYSAAKNVNFLRREQRQRYMLSWDGTQFFREFNVPYDTGDQMTAYAIDQYGNMYAANEEEMTNVNPEGSRFNHSSLNAGKAVISAGIVRFERGQLKYIDNMSGHYKPGVEQVHNAVQLIKEMGVPIDDLEVAVCFVRTETGADVQEMAYYNAVAFANNIHALPVRYDPPRRPGAATVATPPVLGPASQLAQAAPSAPFLPFALPTDF